MILDKNTKEIEGSDGLYVINTKGVIISYAMTIRGKVMEGRVKPCRLGVKRLSVNIKINGTKGMKQVHRLVAQAFIPNPENLPFVRHRNGDALDNHITNLEWANQVGEDNRSAKVTESVATKIWRSKGKKTAIAISNEYNVPVKNVENILYGDNWNSIK